MTTPGWVYRVTYPRSKGEYDGPRDSRTFTDYEDALGLVKFVGYRLHPSVVTFEKRRILYSDWEPVDG